MWSCSRRFVVISSASPASNNLIRQFCSKHPTAVLPSQLLDLLVCPLSKDQLIPKEQSLQSHAAGISYPIMYENGRAIINMIPRDATLLLQENEHA